MAYSAVSVHRAVDVVMKGKLHLKKKMVDQAQKFSMGEVCAFV